MTEEKRHTEIALSGSSGSPGVAMGDAFIYNRENLSVSDKKIEPEDIDDHVSRFERAKQKTVKELELLLDDSLEEEADKVVRTQIEMINDPDLNRRVIAKIKENLLPADSAVQQVFDEFLQLISVRDTRQFLENTIDISDVRDRLIQIINNQQAHYDLPNGSIVVAKELSPREVIELAEYEIKGIVTDHGGATSHAAIVARSINIPAVLGVKNATKYIDQGRYIIVDGEAGNIIVAPDEEKKDVYRQRVRKEREKEEFQQKICQKPSVTPDGESFVLRANIEFEKELPKVGKYNARGVGLLRTESVYLHRERFGDQEKQEDFYNAVLEGTGKHPVTIRLFDAGGDKFFNLGDKEHNPFLGWRGIRMLLDKQHLLRAQLKAILKVAARNHGRIKILVPMVSCLEEVMRLKEIIMHEQGTLIKKGIPVDEEIELGIMVEVPSVAIQADAFAQHVDFLSIGTNDLTQYTMAVDRGNELISHLYDQRFPAVWRLIEQTARAAASNGIDICVCGELASDPVAACCLMGLGISDLSMSPSSIPKVKSLLMDRTVAEMQALANDVLKCDTLEEVDTLFHKWKTDNNNQKQ